jgi:ABC-type branched-subunit amino acid transport system substrate-binding protein
MAAFRPASAEWKFIQINNRRRDMGSFAKWFGKSVLLTAATTLGMMSLGHAQAKPEKFKIGGVLSLSGPYGLLGEDMRRGVQIAIEERGSKVLGTPIEVTWEDDETKPQPAVQKATKLISGGSHMIFGAISSASTLAIMNLTKQRKIPHLVTISADDKITVPGGSRYTFRTSNNLDMENRMALAYMQEKKLKKIYAVTADYQATRDGYEWIKKQVGSQGIQIVGEDFPPLGNRDYSSIVDKIAKSDAEGVLMMLTGSDVVTLIKQAGQVNLGKSKLLFGPVAADETMAAAVGPAAMGVNSGLRYDHTIDTDANRKFVEAYRKKFGALPTMTAGEAYDGMSWWLDTVEKTGSWDKEKWVDAFASSVRENSVEGRKVMRACDHQASQPGFWGEVVPGTPPAPALTMKITKIFPEEKLFTACKN